MNWGALLSSLVTGLVAFVIIGSFTNTAILLSAPTVSNPYVGGNPYKVQTHCHVLGAWDDGLLTATQVLTMYKGLGYDAVAVTSHYGITVDPVVAGVTYIRGMEKVVYTAEGPVSGHYLQYGRITPYHPDGDIRVYQAELIADGGIGGPAHPGPIPSPNPPVGYSWLATGDWLLTTPHIVEVQGPQGPGEPDWENFFDDQIYHNGVLRKNVWGLSGDDFHEGLGGWCWNIIYAPANTEAALVASMKAGNMYMSRGPTIAVTVSGNIITVTTGAASTITWKHKGGAVVKSTSGVLSSSYAATHEDIYVRAVVTRASDGKKALTQPFYVN